MQKEVTIIGTQDECYLACVDAERARYHCDESCGGCPYPCRILLDKEEPLEKGMRLLAEVPEPLINTPEKLIPMLVGIFAVFVVLMWVARRSFFPHYRGYTAIILSGFFAALALFSILKSYDEKRKAGKSLRKGKIVSVFPKDGA